MSDCCSDLTACSMSRHTNAAAPARKSTSASVGSLGTSSSTISLRRLPMRLPSSCISLITWAAGFSSGCSSSSDSRSSSQKACLCIAWAASSATPRNSLRRPSIHGVNLAMSALDLPRVAKAPAASTASAGASVISFTLSIPSSKVPASSLLTSTAMWGGLPEARSAAGSFSRPSSTSTASGETSSLFSLSARACAYPNACGVSGGVLLCSPSGDSTSSTRESGDNGNDGSIHAPPSSIFASHQRRTATNAASPLLSPR
mmetsp:Transcript_26134/g.43198  ORF Transcript_26134/g.43198 Transcript_26134/m.43198 type:complete len:259 (+) Transcript_26134:1459-2235(+)